MSKLIVLFASLACGAVAVPVDAKDNERLISDLLVCGWSYALEDRQDNPFEDFIVKAGELAAVEDRDKAWLASEVRDAEVAARDHSWEGRRGTVCAELLTVAGMRLKAEHQP